MISVFKPPYKPTSFLPGTIKIFLAGTIDMGNSIDWQKKFTEDLALTDVQGDICIFNPRREDWDSSWDQTILHPQFKEQVEWELQYQEEADIIVFYFAPGSMSMITLLELGKFSSYSKKKILVVCSDGYMRKGNVDIFCKRYKIPQFNTLEDLCPIIQYLVKKS